MLQQTRGLRRPTIDLNCTLFKNSCGLYYWELSRIKKANKGQVGEIFIALF